MAFIQDAIKTELGNNKVQLAVQESLFIKNPDSSKLGRIIITNSIELIEEIGFEAFNFKKLGKRIGSPECTIYRYFENKQKVLLYLTSWYWSWLEYKMDFAITNVLDPQLKLSKAIEVLTETVEQDLSFSHINEFLLNRIVISESVKSLFTREVDSENAAGVFKVYKRIVQRVSDMILSINKDFEYPHMLVSIVIEGSHQQRYFADHLPGLTDIIEGKGGVTDFFNKMVFKTIDIK
jgi:AcrR family transcriptional regulator